MGRVAVCSWINVHSVERWGGEEGMWNRIAWAGVCLVVLGQHLERARSVAGNIAWIWD